MIFQSGTKPTTSGIKALYFNAGLGTFILGFMPNSSRNQSNSDKMGQKPLVKGKVLLPGGCASSDLSGKRQDRGEINKHFKLLISQEQTRSPKPKPAGLFRFFVWLDLCPALCPWHDTSLLPIYAPLLPSNDAGICAYIPQVRYVRAIDVGIV